jgi:CheY-like chemotaxis protein
MSKTRRPSSEEQARLAFPDEIDAPPQRLPAPRSARPIASLNQSQGSRVLPWHSSSRHLAETSASRTPTHGALALLEQPDVYPDARPVTSRHSILLAEDDFRLASAMRSALELEGESAWQVTVASSGSRALELAAANPPHVILLDIFLPDLDGAEVYRQLRINPATRSTRVVFVTAATSLDLYERGIPNGVLLRKPFDVRDLVGVVRALLADEKA